jgi:hypothetical protein
MEDLSGFSARPRLRALLDHFAEITDARQAWKVMYPLREVLFLGEVCVHGVPCFQKDQHIYSTDLLQ